jgi:hypothetical protein
MLDENDAARGLIRAVLQERVQLRLGEQMQIKMKGRCHENTARVRLVGARPVAG